GPAIVPLRLRFGCRRRRFGLPRRRFHLGQLATDDRLASSLGDRLPGRRKTRIRPAQHGLAELVDLLLVGHVPVVRALGLDRESPVGAAVTPGGLALEAYVLLGHRAGCP